MSELESAPVVPTPSPEATSHNGDDFHRIYDRELSWVWRALWRLGVRTADLEDATQDVFVVVYRKLDTWDRARPLRPWLFGICFRIALDRRRRASARHEVDMAEGSEERVDDGGAHDPHRAAERHEAKQRVERGLSALPMEQRAVFVLHELEGLSIPECVEVLEAPLNTLYSRLRLARAAFAEAVRGPTRSAP